MAIKQFNATYSKEEDRILWRFNTHQNEEYRFWLTRFIALSLLRAIDQLMQQSLERQHDPRTAGMVKEFQEDGVRKTTNLKQVYEIASTYPLGEDPILMTGFSINLTEGQFGLKLDLKTGTSLSVNLPVVTVQSLNYLFKKTVEAAAWGGDESPCVPSTSGEGTASPPPTQLH